MGRRGDTQPHSQARCYLAELLEQPQATLPHRPGPVRARPEPQGSCGLQPVAEAFLLQTYTQQLSSDLQPLALRQV